MLLSALLQDQVKGFSFWKSGFTGHRQKHVIHGGISGRFAYSAQLSACEPRKNWFWWHAVESHPPHIPNSLSGLLSFSVGDHCTLEGQ